MKSFKRSLVAFSFLLGMGIVGINAQNLKFGKPSQAEWEFASMPEVPDAEAVILCKTVKVEYHLRGDFRMYDTPNMEISSSNLVGNVQNQGINEDNTSLTYEVKMRTKILKDSGKGYANVDVIYYNDAHDNHNYDEFYSMNVVVFDMVNGKMKRSRVASNSFKDERVNDNFVVRHIQVPNVKAGSIVELQYQLFSKRYSYLYDWQLEENIPVVYSRCEMEIPAFLTFNMQVPIHPSITNSVKGGTITLENSSVDLSAPKQCRSNKYLIECRDAMPFNPNEKRAEANKGFVSIRPQLLNKIDTPNVQLPSGKRHLMVNP